MKERRKKEKIMILDDEAFLPSLKDQMWNIINNFDFDYVSKVMAMNIRKDSCTGEMIPWTTNTNLTPVSVPTVERLTASAIRLLQSAIDVDHDVYICRSGPFRVIKAHNRLILDFCLKTYSYD